MASYAHQRGLPCRSLENLTVDTFWDGVFHASNYIFIVIGLAILWHAARRSHLPWSGKMLFGSILMGFGIFNLVEGIVDHDILQIHYVNETVRVDQWVYWDIGFMVWGAAMLAGGRLLLNAGKRETAARPPG